MREVALLTPDLNMHILIVLTITLLVQRRFASFKLRCRAIVLCHLQLPTNSLLTLHLLTVSSDFVLIIVSNNRVF